MLHHTSKLIGLSIHAADGDIGSVQDFYFDDERWVIRYMVVDTGGWLGGRRVLISPISASAKDWSDGRIAVNLTREQVRNSPDIDRHRPVSRQREIEYYAYYGYPFYWGDAGIWGAGAFPSALAAGPGPGAVLQRELSERPGIADSHLHSTNEVKGYHLAALDGEIGHVDDFVIDDKSWAIAELLVDTSNWLGGRHVLIPTRALRGVDWAHQKLEVDLTRDAIAAIPAS